MNVFEVIGWVGSVLMVATFAMKRMIPLRITGICANCFMIVYAFALGIYPVLAIQTCLLPINIYRLVQMRRLVTSLNLAKSTDGLQVLAPVMQRQNLKKGEALFRKGDSADQLFIVAQGALRLEELGIVLNPGEVVGEMGLFGIEHDRSATAVAEADSEVLRIAGDRVREIVHQDPNLGLAIMRVMAQRLRIANK
jgi:hypothetical protein